MRPAPFQLDKWYFDAVTDDGLCVICHRAVLRYRAMRVAYGAALVSPPGKAATTRTSLRCTPEPAIDGGTVRWSSPVLGVSLEMVSTLAGLNRTLAENADGRIQWHCSAPAARVRLVLDGQTFDAAGYAERLVVTIPPHRVPIRGLRWGRFIGGGGFSAVWIQWRGPQGLDLLFADGVEAARPEIADGRCAWVDGEGRRRELRMDRARELRSGELARTLGAVLPKVRALSPPMLRAALGMEESRWLSRATVATPGAPDAAGWAVHELVRFPEAAK